MFDLRVGDSIEIPDEPDSIELQEFEDSKFRLHDKRNSPDSRDSEAVALLVTGDER